MNGRWIYHERDERTTIAYRHQLFFWQDDNQKVPSATYVKAFEFFSSKLEELVLAAGEIIRRLDDLSMRLIPFDTTVNFAEKKREGWPQKTSGLTSTNIEECFITVYENRDEEFYRAGVWVQLSKNSSTKSNRPRKSSILSIYRKLRIYFSWPCP
jgi:hypothetical protein